LRHTAIFSGETIGENQENRRKRGSNKGEEKRTGGEFSSFLLEKLRRISP